jgi:hypothetical protein
MGEREWKGIDTYLGKDIGISDFSCLITEYTRKKEEYRSR